MSGLYRGYETSFPDLILEILKYFHASENRTPINERSVIDFCQRVTSEKGLESLCQPDTVNRICEKLCDKGMLVRINTDVQTGLKNNYLFHTRDDFNFNNEIEQKRCFFNSLVYGFDYIYNLYRDIVIPLIWQTDDNDYYMGTGFKYHDGIATAKHCIEDAKHLQIKGFKAKDLENAKIYISDNPGVDLAFIHTQRKAEVLLYSQNGELMQEVLVMGYPRIPAFTSFLTAEKATISSKAEARLTPTKGNIAAYGEEYLAKIEAMLITARIRGGNSGGPVINENGCIVGVACQIPDFNDNENNYYDDLGYGIAVPVRYLNDIINSKPAWIDVSQDYFQDYIE